MTIPSNERLKQLDEHLATNNQAWLFGAGISFAAGVPLMQALTQRIFAIAESETDTTAKKMLKETEKLLPNTSHIEHILSHWSDHVAIADRSTNKEIKIGSTKVDVVKLRELHAIVLTWIADTIRWGYIPAQGTEPEKVGSRTDPIVVVKYHQNFVDALFNRSQAGLAERRLAVTLFTTNYDTLLEDSLALGRFSYWDGFAGGAVAYRSYVYGQNVPKSLDRAHVVKLHGSIDWHLDENDRVWRIRDGDSYPPNHSRVLIYPQATKYLATQRDPFAAQFDLLRRNLGSGMENVLAICGYAFGDEHINQEIELALQRSDNNTTLLAFANECGEKLKEWLAKPWGKRLYVMAPDGLYVGNEGPFYTPPSGEILDWWKFEGVTKLLNDGAEVCVQ